MLNGENIGLCIHKMIGGELDGGDIIMRDYLSIDSTQSHDSLGVDVDANT